MAINYSSPGVPGGEVSPGAGSTGFTSNSVAFANSSGQIDGTTRLNVTNPAASSVQFWIQSTHSANATSTSAGALRIGVPGSSFIAYDQNGIAAKTSAGAGRALELNFAGGNVQVGSSNVAGKLSLPSTVNMSSAVGAAGGAAALPATPESYIKVLAPGNNGTLTTLYLPAYLST